MEGSIPEKGNHKENGDVKVNGSDVENGLSKKLEAVTVEEPDAGNKGVLEEKENLEERKNLDDQGDAGGHGYVPGGKRTQPLPHRLARMTADQNADTYNFSHPKRGLCVIFNHKNFDRSTQLGIRNGTDRDRDQCKQLFTSLGFDVKVHNDLTVAGIKQVLEEVAYDEDHTGYDCLAVVYMSHGEQDIFYGYDGNFKAETLFDKFTADICPSLAGKPKFFFIQACRGDGLDQGVQMVHTRVSDETDSGYLSYKIPTTCDFLICWSTVPGQFSWRNTSNGSWFIQSLVHILQSHGLTEDLATLMTKVNRHMILNFESNCPSAPHMHGKKQCATIVSTLMRKVQFNKKF